MAGIATVLRLPLRFARRLANAVLGSPEKREIEPSYVAEMELFSHTSLPRPWLRTEEDGPCQVDESELDVVEFDLRRFEHAIDKGLLLADRRPGFGRDKIRCLLKMMQVLSGHESRCRAVANAVAILRNYRRALDDDMANEALSADRQELLDWAAELDEALARYSELVCSAPQAPSYDGLSECFFGRRSVRRWSNRKVERDALRAIVDAALWSPSSCNRQPHVFLFVEDLAKKVLIVRTATGASGFAESAPVICVLLNDVRAYYGPCERHLAYVDTALAAGSLTLAAHELGIGTVWLNWALPDLADEKPVREALGIKPWHAMVALIAMGYPDESSQSSVSVRRQVDDVVSFDSL